MKKKFTRIAFFAFFLMLSSVLVAQQGIVNKYGRLQVYGSHVCSESGEQISLGGMSFFWSCWDNNYYNGNTVNFLVSDMNVSIVRAAAAVAHTPNNYTEIGDVSASGDGGILMNYDGTKAKIQAVVNAAIANDIYVIIDWHIEGKADKEGWWMGQAKKFFGEMAQQYGNNPHVIYEVYNEPAHDGDDTGMIQWWCQEMVNEIRKYDSDNLIICGSSTWSQNPQSYTINDNNVAYTFHAYPDAGYGGSHMSAFYSNVPAAMNAGKAVFVTEFGAQGSDDGSYVDHDRTDEFINQCREWGISYCAWAVNNKREPWSIFYDGHNLTAIGQYYKSLMGGSCDGCGGNCDKATASEINTTIEAENYCEADGVQKEDCSEGGQNVSYIDADDWMKYKINIPVAGEYKIEYRVASLNGGGRIQFEKAGGLESYGQVDVPSTSGWQNWITIEQTVILPQGEQIYAIAAKAGGFNINNFKVIGGGTPCSAISLPAKHESESYCNMSGIQVEDCAEGGQNIGYINQGDWFSYQVNVPSAASYSIQFRVASLAGSSFQLERKDNGKVFGTVTVPATGDWQAWQTVTANVQLDQGEYELVFKSIQSDGWNINWFNVGGDPDDYTLNVSSTSCGNVTIDPLKSTYTPGDVVTLTANASSGANFINWAGDATGTSPVIQITMDANKSISANFTSGCGGNDDYPFGTLPSIANKAEAQSAYVTFMDLFFEDCGDGKGRIKWGLPANSWENPGQTVSEGIAYGMLYAAYFNDQARFDKLWAYYKAFPDANGLMHWKTSGCSSVVQQNAATDAEVDAAMALIVADSKWGNYRSDAEWLIGKIKTHEVESGTYVLKPGDVFGGSQQTNISYFAPGYFRVFGQYTNDIAFWNSVADKCYDIIDNNLNANNAVGGLVSDWCKADGTQAGGSSLDYSYDACRTNWRIATDYVWYGESRAKAYLDKSNSFVSNIGGITEVKDGYLQNGQLKPGDRYHNTTFVSTFACAGVAFSNVTDANTYYAEIGVPDIVSYFDYCFDLFSRTLLTGLFQNPLNVDPDKVTLSVNIVGDGTVSLNPSGGVYDIGTVVTVEVTSGDFVGWSGAASGTATTVSIIMDSNKSLTATFEGGGGCDNPVATSVPFSQDGNTEHCWVTSDEIDYINSWAAEKVEINGVDITNIWVNSFPAKQDGKYYIYFKGLESWGHIEVTSPNKSAAESKISTVTDIQTLNEVKAYPNPLRTGNLIILGTDEIINSVINVHDLSGKQVLKIDNVTSKRIEISREKFKTGFYFIDIEKGNFKQTLKLIVE